MRARWLVVGVVLAFVLSNFSAAQPAEPPPVFEIATARTVYRTVNGIQSDARPVHEILRETLVAIPWSYVGNASTVGGLAVAVFFPELVLLSGTLIFAGLFADGNEAFEELVNSQHALDERAAGGRYAFVNREGRAMTPDEVVAPLGSSPFLPKNDTVTYIRRHIPDPRAPGIIKGFVFQVLTALSLESWLGTRVRFNVEPIDTIAGELAETAADRIGRETRPFRYGADVSNCAFTWTRIGGFQPVNTCASLQPSISPAPLAPTPMAVVEAAQVQVAQTVPTEWFTGGRMVEITPISTTRVDITSSTSMPERSFRHGPTKIELTGDFGGFILK